MPVARVPYPLPCLTPATTTGAIRAALVSVAIAATTLVPQSAQAQAGRPATTLAPKRALSRSAVAACLRAPPPVRAPRRDELAARAAAARARELALVGDRAGARAGFARALALDPLSPQLAYDLARAAEESADAPGAIGAYCQYLALAPAGGDAADARARVARLTGGASESTERRARDAFARGVAALDGARYPAAFAAFDEVLRTAPNTPEAAYNRGLAALALGRDGDAARDLAAYVASPAAGADRAEVLRAVEVLRRPGWHPREALVRGLVPGFGQVYTARPVAGVAVLAATVGSAVVAFTPRTTQRDVTFVDPFGNAYASRVAERRRPYLVTGLAAGATLAVAAALEASSFAARAQRMRPVVSVQTAPVPPPAARDAPGGGPGGLRDGELRDGGVRGLELTVGVGVRF
jgi:hypothetical protein